MCARRDLCTNYRFRSHRHRKGPLTKRQMQARRKQLQSEEDWLEIYNSSPHTRGFYIHHCGFGCKCESPADSVTRSIRATKNYLFGYMCKPPSGDDWESTPLNVDWPCVDCLRSRLNILLLLQTDHTLQVGNMQCESWLIHAW